MDGDEPAVSVEAAALLWPGEESVEHVTAESSNGAREETLASGRSHATSTGATSTLPPSFCCEPEVCDEPRLLAFPPA